MASNIGITMLLADAAQEAGGGKVSMLGAGWTVAASPMPPHAVVAFISIPWDLTNQPIAFALELLSEDGNPVELPTAAGPQRLRLEGDLEAGRPPGSKPGSYFTMPLVQSFGSLPLPPGRYEWRLTAGVDVEPLSFELIAPPLGHG